MIDNNRECYYFSVNHKTLTQLVDHECKARWSNDAIKFTHVIERKNLDNDAYQLKPNDEQQNAFGGFVFPTFIPMMFPGPPNVTLLQIIPTGVETTRARWDFYLTNRQPGEQESRLLRYVKGVLFPEDVRLCEAVQRGLHSRGYCQGRFVVDRNHVDFSEHQSFLPEIGTRCADTLQKSVPHALRAGSL